MKNFIEVLAYRPGVKGTRIGFFDVEIGPPDLRLRIEDCILHRDPTCGTTWIQAPSAAQEDVAGKARIGPDGRPAFKTVATFPHKAALRRLTDEVVRQITAKWGAP